MATSDIEISKFMSYVLRHRPDELGIELDGQGWTDFDTLAEKLCVRLGVSDEDIKRVIAENSKQRFTLAGNRIRAAQGHSVSVTLDLSPVAPPETLYHGTSASAWSSISKTGLKPMGRTHVHLSGDIETARIVAHRRKAPHILLTISARQMAEQGYPFFVADNGVWLTHEVPPHFLHSIQETDR